MSRALARAAGALNFEITVLDNRPDLPTLAANDDAHHSHVLGSYEALAATAPPPLRSGEIVGYRIGAVALRQLIGFPGAYLGVMGRAAKVTELRRVLAKEGFPAAELIRLRGPTRAIINSRTPEEIAVNVAAELIAVRNAVPGAGP